MKKAGLILPLIVLLAGISSAWAENPGEKEVRDTLAKFIVAFDNLDWEQFRSFFADDATVFYPRAVAERAAGRPALEANFKKVFDGIRGTQSHPPYMHIEPRDLQLQMFGDIAVVTFHLDDRPGMLNRRTIVLQKTASGWKIVHLHASEVAVSSR